MSAVKWPSREVCHDNGVTEAIRIEYGRSTWTNGNPRIHLVVLSQGEDKPFTFGIRIYYNGVRLLSTFEVPRLGLECGASGMAMIQVFADLIATSMLVCLFPTIATEKYNDFCAMLKDHTALWCTETFIDTCISMLRNDILRCQDIDSCINAGVRTALQVNTEYYDKVLESTSEVLAPYLPRVLNNYIADYLYHGVTHTDINLVQEALPTMRSVFRR